MCEDFEWFENHYEEFQRKYGNAFLVIKNKCVIGVYDSYGKGVRETQKTEALGSFIVQECCKDRVRLLNSIKALREKEYRVS